MKSYAWEQLYGFDRFDLNEYPYRRLMGYIVRNRTTNGSDAVVVTRDQMGYVTSYKNMPDPDAVHEWSVFCVGSDDQGIWRQVSQLERTFKKIDEAKAALHDKLGLESEPMMKVWKGNLNVYD